MWLHFLEGPFPLKLQLLSANRPGKSVGTGFPLCPSQSSLRPRPPACASPLEAYQAVGRENEQGPRTCPQPSSTFVLSTGSFHALYRAPTVRGDSGTEQDTHRAIEKLVVGLEVEMGVREGVSLHSEPKAEGRQG